MQTFLYLHDQHPLVLLKLYVRIFSVECAKSVYSLILYQTDADDIISSDNGAPLSSLSEHEKQGLSVQLTGRTSSASRTTH